MQSGQIIVPVDLEICGIEHQRLDHNHNNKADPYTDHLIGST